MDLYASPPAGGPGKASLLSGSMSRLAKLAAGRPSAPPK